MSSSVLGPALMLRKRFLKALSATVGTAYGAVKRGARSQCESHARGMLEPGGRAVGEERPERPNRHRRGAAPGGGGPDADASRAGTGGGTRGTGSGTGTG